MELFALASLAAVAGVVSFTSPCALPLLPGYVSWVSGLSGDGAEAAGRPPVMRGALLFVVGFSVVFTLLGLTASAVGLLLVQGRQTLTVAGGVVVIAMGLVSLGAVRVPLLQRQARLDLRRIAQGPAGAMPLGAAFAIGWTPCVGPVLTGVLATAATAGSTAHGAVLLMAYSGGLGVPFLLVAAGVRRGRARLSWLRRHGRAVERAGGVLLVVMGALMVMGSWTALLSRVLSLYARVGWPPI